MDVLNYIDGKWIRADVAEHYDVVNPATAICLRGHPYPAPRKLRRRQRRQRPRWWNGAGFRSRSACSISSSCGICCSRTWTALRGRSLRRPERP